MSACGVCVLVSVLSTLWPCLGVERGSVEVEAERRLRHQTHRPQPSNAPTAALSNSTPHTVDEEEEAGGASGRGRGREGGEIGVDRMTDERVELGLVTSSADAVEEEEDECMENEHNTAE